MQVRGQGRVTFAAILLLIAGVLNLIYGIAAISNAHFFTEGGSHSSSPASAPGAGSWWSSQ